MTNSSFRFYNWVGPIRFASSTLFNAIEIVTDSIQNKIVLGHIHFVNAYTISLADRDLSYLEVFQSGSINFPDGKPISWISKLRADKHVLRQIKGPEFFELCLDRGRSKKIKHFFLGSTEETLLQLKNQIENKYPGVEIVGTYSPPFRGLTALELNEQDNFILKANPDVIWVGLGTPKQDYEAKRLTHKHKVTAIAIGAAFDFSAGTVPKCPSLISSLGLEWLFRLFTEPKRLWKRYLIGNPRFIRSVINPISKPAR